MIRGGERGKKGGKAQGGRMRKEAYLHVFVYCSFLECSKGEGVQ